MIYCTLNWLHMTNIGLSSSSGGLWGSLKCTAVKFADDCTNMIIAEDECQIESEMMKPMIVYVYTGFRMCATPFLDLVFAKCDDHLTIIWNYLSLICKTEILYQPHLCLKHSILYVRSLS